MDDPESKKDKSRRFAELLRVQEEISRKNNAALVGKKVRLLIEEHEHGVPVGRSSENLVLHLEGESFEEGTFVNAEITSFDGVLHGKSCE